MSRNIQNVTKWLSQDVNDYEYVFNDCKDFKTVTANILQRICTILEYFRKKHVIKIQYCLTQNELQFQELEDINLTLNTLIINLKSVLQGLTKNNSTNFLFEKIEFWKILLWKMKSKIVYALQELINNTAYLFIYYGENYLQLVLKISTVYNQLLLLDNKFGCTKNISVCNNTCPYLFYPLYKISVTKLLQLISNNRAELCCHKLIDCLLETYKIYDTNDEDNCSDNSSLEIYRALTKHMSPPNVPEKNSNIKYIDFEPVVKEIETFGNIYELIRNEEKNILDFLAMAVKIAPEMLGNDCIKTSKSTGIHKLNSKAREKVLEYYEQILWGEVGSFLEHVILWWTYYPLSSRSPHSSQHLREWIIQFIPSADVPSVIISALSSLADALGVHVTSTSWDQHFRLALVASNTLYNEETGKLFCSILQNLVILCNQYEVTHEWIVGAPLDELPLVEQIPILHRLDHSIHFTRLWAINETKKVANNWNVDAFFIIIHTDIINCLSQLSLLKFTDHTTEIYKGGLDVHIQVCTLMRAKLVSEVNINKEKLKITPNECVQSLANICRTICLASLQMIYPESSYWKQNGNEIAQKPSLYVDKYLDHILTPILIATNNHVISNMILQIMCESWLDHIYTNKIKFSQFGACQLLCDFGYVTLWLRNCSIISHTMRKKMLKNEVLRRCEGVGRLLLRCPGEQIKMMEKNKAINIESSPNSEKTESMPAEMYVPNQEQWLELRAVRKKKLFVSSCCRTF